MGTLEELGEPPQERDGEGMLVLLRAHATELRRLRSDRAADALAASRAAAEREQGAHVAEEGIRAIASELRLPASVSPSECLQRVTELRIGEAVLEGLAAQLRCKETKELPQRLQALLLLCDERVAAQRIVDALQKLLRAGSIQEVLPALKEVLD